MINIMLSKLVVQKNNKFMKTIAKVIVFSSFLTVYPVINDFFLSSTIPIVLAQDTQISLEGTWNWYCCQGNFWGELEIYQNGNIITGSFRDHRNGTGGNINGIIESKKIQMTRNWENNSQLLILKLSQNGEILKGTIKGSFISGETEFTATRREEQNDNLNGMWNDSWGSDNWQINHNLKANEFTVLLPNRRGPYRGQFIEQNQIFVKFYDDPANPASCCTGVLTPNARKIQWSNGAVWSR